jgi:hypothetical protein
MTHAGTGIGMTAARVYFHALVRAPTPQKIRADILGGSATGVNSMLRNRRGQDGRTR